MTFDIIGYIVLLGGSVVYLFIRGRRYGSRPDSSWPGAILRSVAWSLVTCWTIYGLATGHGPSLLLLPSWIAILIATFEGYIGAIPSLWVSPLVPIFSFLVSVCFARES